MTSNIRSEAASRPDLIQALDVRFWPIPARGISLIRMPAHCLPRGESVICLLIRLLALLHKQHPIAEHQP